jgi:hypothetical protein
MVVSFSLSWLMAMGKKAIMTINDYSDLLKDKDMQYTTSAFLALRWIYPLFL